MTEQTSLPDETAKELAWPLRLTRAGMTAEAAVRAFWPLWSVLLVCLAALMLGLHETLPLELVWTLGVLVVLGFGWAAWKGFSGFRMPSQSEALDRLDATLPGRPLAALSDTQAIGSGDPASEAVWAAHVARMRSRAEGATAPEPDLKLSSRDRYGLRYVALLAFTVALLFGSFLRVASVADMAPGAGTTPLVTGPAWEGWVEPPLYTGQPTLYLNDITRAGFDVPQDSRVTIRFYGQVGELTLSETVSGRTENIPPATEPTQTFNVEQAGDIEIGGPGGRSWSINVTPDEPPTVEFDGPISRGEQGRMEAPFVALDDYGVDGGTVLIALDLGSVDRRYGLTRAPEPRPEIELDLPLPISGDRADFAETIIEDLSQHPYANLPVTVRLQAEDALGQVGESETLQAILPGRRFFDPLAKAVIEQRRDILWNRDNMHSTTQVLRAVSYNPDEIFYSATVYLRLRHAIRQMETRVSLGALDDEFLDEMADVLWGIAVELEEGDLSSALERLRRAQDRLAEAIENGASEDEIAELMQELRDAMQDYMRQLAEQSQQQQGNQQAQNNQGQQQEMTSQDLEDMLQRLQELMEQGRMAEAQELLDQLRQMMENMQVAEGQQGQGGQGQGEQAMEGLAETLREQQGLSDEAFRDLQEQANPNAQQGNSQGNVGRDGDLGRGQQHGQSGQGQSGDQQGQEGQPGQPNGQQGQDPGGSLADRQQALRQELQRQQNSLPGAGTPEGDAAREALGRAGEAMDDAEESLRNEDFAGALDDQSRAIDELREGMQNLADQMAQEQQQGQGNAQDQQQAGRNGPGGERDPLDRPTGPFDPESRNRGFVPDGDELTGRAQELMDEIRRRSIEQGRPGEELDYLKRLLDRF